MAFIYQTPVLLSPETFARVLKMVIMWDFTSTQSTNPREFKGPLVSPVILNIQSPEDVFLSSYNIAGSIAASEQSLFSDPDYRNQYQISHFNNTILLNDDVQRATYYEIAEEAQVHLDALTMNRNPSFGPHDITYIQENQGTQRISISSPIPLLVTPFSSLNSYDSQFTFKAFDNPIYSPLSNFDNPIYSPISNFYSQYQTRNSPLEHSNCLERIYNDPMPSTLERFGYNTTSSQILKSTTMNRIYRENSIERSNFGQLTIRNQNFKSPTQLNDSSMVNFNQIMSPSDQLNNEFECLTMEHHSMSPIPRDRLDSSQEIMIRKTNQQMNVNIFENLNFQSSGIQNPVKHLNNSEELSFMSLNPISKSYCESNSQNLYTSNRLNIELLPQWNHENIASPVRQSKFLDNEFLIQNSSIPSVSISPTHTCQSSSEILQPLNVVEDIKQSIDLIKEDSAMTFSPPRGRKTRPENERKNEKVGKCSKWVSLSCKTPIAFRRFLDLKRHKNSFHSDQEYYCCGKFKRKDNLKIHLIKKHDVDVPNLKDECEKRKWAFMSDHEK
ncbi:hypothetical protein HK096_008864 [Nowakowskiella sp. JEL0078]|nr:hypothetical protein HK096_008864 [Nowakowskiella sp. JEL0078]